MKLKKRDTIELPHEWNCGCRFSLIDGGLRSLLERCVLHGNAPKMFDTLVKIYANAGESPEWIRAQISPIMESVAINEK